MQASIASKQADRVEETAALLGALMKRVMRATGGDFIQAMEDQGLSLSQIKSLGCLSDGEPASLGQLGERVRLSLPAVSRAVEGLVQREYVTREEDPDDRRSKRVRITRKGRRTFEQLMAIRAAGLREFVESLEPGERDALLDGLRAIGGSER